MIALQPNPFYNWFEVTYKVHGDIKKATLYAYNGHHAFLGLVYGDKITHNQYQFINSKKIW